MIRLSQEKQAELINYITDTETTYDELLNTRKSRMLRVAEECKTFEGKKTQGWQTTFKVNKAHEIENKIMPRIIANNPKWIVARRTDEFDA